MKFPYQWYANGDTNSMCCLTGELKMTVKRASTGRYRPKDPNLDQRLAVWFSDQRKQGTIKYYFAICAN